MIKGSKDWCQDMEQLILKTREQWRQWLSRNHDRSDGVWLVFYKKHTGKSTLAYDDAVEEALCFGWIDSLIKKLDDDRYVRKMTPRNASSLWSPLNRKRIDKLMKQGLMAEPGLTKIEEAKKTGAWDKPDRPGLSGEFPVELTSALAKHKKAQAFFAQLAPTYQRHFVLWIATAKRPETKARRVAESIALLGQGKKLGMK